MRNTLHTNLHDAYRHLFASQHAHLLALHHALTEGVESKEPYSVVSQIVHEILKQAHAHCDAKLELMALTLNHDMHQIDKESRSKLLSCKNTLEKISKNNSSSVKNMADELRINMEKCFYESNTILNQFSTFSTLDLGKFTPGKELSVQISVFDIQHQNIHFLLDSIINKAEKKEKRAHTIDLIDDLLEKNTIHFDYEESLMAKYKFPLLDDHKKDHQSFKTQMLVYRDKFSNNSFEASEASMFEIIKLQIEDHILNTDKKYSDFFNQLGIL